MSHRLKLEGSRHWSSFLPIVVECDLSAQHYLFANRLSMATVDTTFSDSAQIPPWPVRRFTVKEYQQLGEFGVLTHEDRVELLEGWIVPKMNQKPAHGYAVGVLTEWMQRHLPSGVIVRCQLPMTTADSEPEPDVAIVRGTHVDYRDRYPSGEDCRLIVEVADTSVERDRLKAAIYASANVEEYWILNLADECLERHTNPSAKGYQSQSTLGKDQQVELRLGDVILRPELSAILS